MEMMKRWRLRLDSLMLLQIAFSCWSLCACISFDAERRALLSFREGVKMDPYGALSNWGKVGANHCSWLGVECSDSGNTVSLNLKDLCLQGKLTSELGRLIHLKSLNLHNNSFSGSIPEEISSLLKLEVLDLGENNFSGPFPHFIFKIPSSLKLVVLRNNMLTIDDGISPELYEPNVLSKLTSASKGSIMRNVGNPLTRRVLSQISNDKEKRHQRELRNKNILYFSSSSLMASQPSSPSSSDSKHQSPSPSSISQSDLQVEQSFRELPRQSNSAQSSSSSGNEEARRPVYVTVGAGAFTLFSLSSMLFICCRTSKVENVMSWKADLSEKLQKAMVIGVPSLKRSELLVACEDFSNVIDCLSDCMLYKGTLINGVEIVATSTTIKVAEDWSDQSEVLFKNKISVLSTVNHKNFLNLIGFCEEQEPFARMLVYEYAPNGTVFEHLHIKEAEPLDWTARLRVAMGTAYCLDHILQLDPPVNLSCLNSSTIYLTEDYAAKVSDLSFGSKKQESCPYDQSDDDWKSPLSNQDIVYKFGIVLLELISGRLPFSKDDGLLVLWASSHLTGKRPLIGLLDQTVNSLCEEDISPLCKVIQSCVNPTAIERPKMRDVVAQLRQITKISPDAATPKLSPLLWAEMEIIS